MLQFKWDCFSFGISRRIPQYVFPVWLLLKNDELMKFFKITSAGRAGALFTIAFNLWSSVLFILPHFNFHWAHICRHFVDALPFWLVGIHSPNIEALGQRESRSETLKNVQQKAPAENPCTYIERWWCAIGILIRSAAYSVRDTQPAVIACSAQPRLLCLMWLSIHLQIFVKHHTSTLCKMNLGGLESISRVNCVITIFLESKKEKENNF